MILSIRTVPTRRQYSGDQRHSILQAFSDISDSHINITMQRHGGGSKGITVWYASSHLQVKQATTGILYVVWRPSTAEAPARHPGGACLWRKWGTANTGLTQCGLSHGSPQSLRWRMRETPGTCRQRSSLGLVTESHSPSPPSPSLGRLRPKIVCEGWVQTEPGFP